MNNEISEQGLALAKELVRASNFIENLPISLGGKGGWQKTIAEQQEEISVLNETLDAIMAIIRLNSYISEVYGDKNYWIENIREDRKWRKIKT